MDLDLRTLRPAPISSTGVIAFVIVRNEAYHLPHLFRQCRELGVASFLVYADRCDAETTEFLFSQPDAYLITSSFSFGDRIASRRLPQLLKESVPDQLFPQRWILTLDADEMFVLPPPFDSLSAFVAALQKEQQPYCLAPLVDLYPARLSERNLSPQTAPLERDLYFDEGPYYSFDPFFPTPRTTDRGVRGRLLKLLTERHPDEVAAIYGPARPAAPVNIKSPLLLHGVGRRRNGSHAISGDVNGRIGAALLHFKFGPDLDAKVANAIQERQYENGSIEYRMLDAALRRFSDEDIRFEGSRKWEGRNSLVAGGLLTAH